MKNKNYVFECFKTTLSIQILSLENCYYIYISSSQMNLDSLTVSFPSQSLGSTSTVELMDEAPSMISSSLSSALSTKLKVPIYLSLNITDEALLSNPMLTQELEKELIGVLSK